MKAVIASSGKELAQRITVAGTLPARLKGLLGKSSLPAGEGLLIRPCMGIHTFFMSFPIDAVFLDKQNRVVALYRSLPPNRMTRILPKAASVMELPADTLGDSLAVGDTVDFS